MDDQTTITTKEATISELVPEAPAPAPEAAAVTTKTQIESTSTGIPRRDESTIGGTSVRGICALISVIVVGVGFLEILTAIMFKVIPLDASTMALVVAISSPLTVIIGMYFGQGNKPKNQQ